MRKIALVNQRYGLEVNGGSEYYTRLIAERLCDKFEVDVITTKAVDYTNWANYYEADSEVINGVCVKRFGVEKERNFSFNVYNTYYMNYIQTNVPDIKKEEVWFEKQGPYAPSAIEYIKRNKANYDIFIFVTYLYYLTVKGMPEVSEKSIFIPTAHEEPFIHFKYYEQFFTKPKAFIFLTDEEKDLVHSLFNCKNIPYEIMGTGVDLPCVPNEKEFREKYNIDSEYLIYVGRIDAGKDCPMMFKYFMEYKKRNQNSKLKLVLMGKAVCKIPQHKDIINLGFVSEEDKFGGIAGAKCLVLPSKFESLSISVLEAMKLSIPVIVNGICHVLKGHCTKSNAGLYYMNYFEFESAVNYMMSNEKEYMEMKNNAKIYIHNNYEWDVIINKFEKIIENIIVERE